jgi:hypothetical protein
MTGCQVQNARDAEGQKFVLCRGTVSALIADGRGADADALFRLQTSRFTSVTFRLPGGLSACVAGYYFNPRLGQRLEVRGGMDGSHTVDVCWKGSYIKSAP